MLALFGAQVWAAPFAYISNARTAAVTVIDTATNAVVGAPIPVGLAPTGVAVNPAGTRVYVANSMSNTVSVIDTTTGAVVGAPIAVGAEPNEVAVNPAGTRVYVANTESNTVSVIDALTNAVIGAPIPVGLLPLGIVVNPAGTRVYVTNSYSNTLSVIDTTNNVVIGAPIVVGASPGSIAINAAGTRLYVANAYDNTVSVVDTTSNAVIGAPIAVGTYPEGIAINPAGTRVYVANGHSDTVSVIDTASNTVVGAPIEMGKGVNPFKIAVHPAGTRVYVTNYQGFTLATIDTATNALVGTPIPAGDYPLGIALAPSAGVMADINQHGLTGSWYQAVTSGQGLEIEVFPDQVAPGTGSVFVSWFTYDTATGGADHQRWYTLQGPVVSGQLYAALTIYQNTGGNFNAPPATSARPVGTATLSFATCSSGTLVYTFSDGTGRAGIIPLTRLTPNVTCSTTSPYPTNADLAHSGNWFAPATSGQGFTVDFNPVSGLFMAWYTYAPIGAGSGAAGQRWYTAQAGAFASGTRSVAVQIYQTTGGVFDTPRVPTTVPVGTGTLVFQSCTAATFSYIFTAGSSSGSSGTIALSRVGPVPPGCTQ
jgi:YVTN family beta-propeller protein